MCLSGHKGHDLLRDLQQGNARVDLQAGGPPEHRLDGFLVAQHVGSFVGSLSVGIVVLVANRSIVTDIGALSRTM